jgi:hypothetical protein
VGIRVQQEAPFTLQIVGRVQEACLFGGHLHLTTTISTTPGSNRFQIHDVVENRSSASAEMQLLYHCNFGPPLLEEGACWSMPAQLIAPRDRRAAQDMANFDTYHAPTAGTSEIVHYCKPLGDLEGNTLAVLSNAARDRACAIRFHLNQLPWFAVWKNMNSLQDGYVTGLEPATNFPNFKAVERRDGRVVTLAPGTGWESILAFEIQDSAEGVARLLGEVDRIQVQQPRRILSHPNPEWGGEGQ